jgi:hypothetical protein
MAGAIDVVCPSPKRKESTPIDENQRQKKFGRIHLQTEED